MSYLVHHGYCSTAEAFAKTCGQAVAEDLVSMQNRQSMSQQENLICTAQHINIDCLWFLSNRNSAASS